MKKEVIRYSKLMIGLFFCALGVVIILKSNLGLSPWDVLNQGLNKTLGITLGQANILVGAIVIILSLFLKQPIGIGTIINVIAVGIFIDIIMALNIIPDGDVILKQVIIFIIGIIVFSYGCYYYMATGLGCGPRDGLMVVLTKRTNHQLWKIKTVIELCALALGYFLGGTVGIGTVASSLLVGPLMQFFFKINKQDAKEIEHRDLLTEFRIIKKAIMK
ncbi:hypothetical protein IX317_001161 [Fusobacterium sp. DD29]|uniref:YczE/YyaS/YitT family protein n=1 Tax=unclassified Fusobacterium TaxID=2648384 RepID=UPI001B8BDC8B|nr:MULTISPECIES: hypothetical protein [unclassified Fusobacterium]MBR8749487.1 hypothetical protein [Fusobacterium sp. DD29]MBR8761748.1 hypothetical protein [Fusobacterium sp. DD25]MBR8767766.1 hypothetical protein [Fusobacterium sp. DD43]MBR8771813.1 hypothetical protein [Fusobacterium sp. DD40]MBR8776042.1 hypothetical protein [Fusobacterium sp. DD17]